MVSLQVCVKEFIAIILKKKPDSLTLLFLTISALSFQLFFLKATFAHTSLRQRWRAQNQLKKLQKATLLCPENYINKVYLLEAELEASRTNHYDNAMFKFNKSIVYAIKYKLNHEQGLAHERVALMNLACQKKDIALYHFNKALDCYTTWGAMGKVSQLKDLRDRELGSIKAMM